VRIIKLLTKGEPKEHIKYRNEGSSFKSKKRLVWKNVKVELAKDL